jgi:hypothetical protein
MDKCISQYSGYPEYKIGRSNKRKKITPEEIKLSRKYALKRNMQTKT